MSVEVRIPTILRSYTDGAKAVEGSGETLDDLCATSSHGTRACASASWRTVLRRFVNVYVNDEDVRFLGGLATRGRRRRGDDPAGCRGRGLRTRCATRACWSRWAAYAARRAAPALARHRTYASGPSSRTATPPAPSRTARPSRWWSGGGATGVLTPGATILEPTSRKHRHLPGHGGEAQGVPADLRDAREHLRRAPPAAGMCGAEVIYSPGRRRLQRGRARGEGAGRRAPRLGDALPVRQPGQRRRPLRDHRPGDLARPARDHPLRGRSRHHRDADGGRAASCASSARRRDRGRRAAVRRAGLRPAQPGRGLRPRAVRRVRADRRFSVGPPDALRRTRRAARRRASSPASRRAPCCTPPSAWLPGRCGRACARTSRWSCATAAGSTCPPGPTRAASTRPRSASKGSSGPEPLALTA